MNWQKLISYVLGGIALIVLGWLLHSTFVPKPTTVVKETVRYDTLYQTKTVTVKETKFIDKPILKDSVRTYYDQTAGEQDSVFYNIQHWLTDGDNQKMKSDWIVNIAPHYSVIKEYITKDSVRTVVESKFVSLPFFLNPYFWSSAVL